MSDNDKLFAKMAAMEMEMEKLRKQPAPAAPAFDPSALINDPVGELSRLGVPVEHISRILVAHTMQQAGITPPPAFQAAAQVGPTINATRALAGQYEQLSRQVSELVTSGKMKSTSEKFKALIVDKTKYPHLARAVAADPSLFDDDVTQHGGTAEELATKLEARHAKLAAAYGLKPTPPVSDENTDVSDEDNSAYAQIDTTQSQQSGAGTDESDTVGNQAGANNGPPPIARKVVNKIWTQEDHERTRDEIVRKYSKQQPV